MIKTKVVTAAALASFVIVLASATPQPAQAFHFTIIGGSCINPGGNAIPFIAALSNPHCNFNVGNGDNGGNGGNGGKSSKSNGGKSNRSSSVGKLVVGCVMGSAIGLITAAAAKAAAAGQPPRWLSQVEYEKTRNNTRNHLSSGEAAKIGFTCGLGAGPVIAKFNQTAR